MLHSVQLRCFAARRPRRTRRPLLVIAALMAPAPALAVPDAPMEELVITGRFIDPAPVTATQTRLSADQIDQARPRSLADALRLAPAAHVTTNSRGQTLVFLRNSGERQTAVFYDGAPITVPWDFRLDLGLVPAAALADVAVTKGPTSVRFGPNTVGGTIELVPAAPPEDGLRLDLRGEAGALASRAGEATALIGAGAWDITLGAGIRDRNAMALPDGADLAFSQPADSDRRLNTDRRRVNGLIRAARAVPGGEVAASALIVDSRFGIAPESHVDPAVDRVRFWRYPDHRLAMGVLSGEFSVGRATTLETSAWVQKFSQTIESYTDAGYDTVTDTQADDDLTLGLRAAVDHRVGRHTLRGSAQLFVATHKQRDTAFAGGEPPSPLPARDLFRQRSISLGGEYGYAATRDLDLFLGAGGDWLTPTRTGGRPDTGGFGDYNLIGGARWRVDEQWTLRASAGRKVRLPTMRELFGTAIDRFLINPDLEPERALLAEFGAQWQSRFLTVEVVPFASLVDDTIDQRNVTVDGRRLRQRVNLEGSRVWGVETSLRAQLTEHLSVLGHLTGMHVRRQQDSADDPVRIAEKPALRARLQLAYEGPQGLGAVASLDHTGRAFSFTDDDLFVPLERSTVIDLEVSYDLATWWPALRQLRAYVRVDNALDTLVEPQLGLPGAGRMVRGGVHWRY